jgi:hypothetical protein
MDKKYEYYYKMMKHLLDGAKITWEQLVDLPT